MIDNASKLSFVAVSGPVYILLTLQRLHSSSMTMMTLCLLVSSTYFTNFSLPTVSITITYDPAHTIFPSPIPRTAEISYQG